MVPGEDEEAKEAAVSSTVASLVIAKLDQTGNKAGHPYGITKYKISEIDYLKSYTIMPQRFERQSRLRWGKKNKTRKQSLMAS
jgi:hypothetical protein